MALVVAASADCLHTAKMECQVSDFRLGLLAHIEARLEVVLTSLSNFLWECLVALVTWMDLEEVLRMVLLRVFSQDLILVLMWAGPSKVLVFYGIDQVSGAQVRIVEEVKVVMFVCLGHFY